jgi:hypothetical protein
VSRAKPAVVRFYFDADVVGLAHVVAALRNDATYPGDPGAIIKRRERPPCPVTDPATKDDVWIPAVASLGWLVITRDSRIQQHRAEIAAIKINSARVIALSGNEARGTWQQLEVLMRHWRAIEALATGRAPSSTPPHGHPSRPSILTEPRAASESNRSLRCTITGEDGPIPIRRRTARPANTAATKYF